MCYPCRLMFFYCGPSSCLIECFGNSFTIALIPEVPVFFWSVHQGAERKENTKLRTSFSQELVDCARRALHVEVVAWRGSYCHPESQEVFKLRRFGVFFGVLDTVFNRRG